MAEMNEDATSYGKLGASPGRHWARRGAPSEAGEGGGSRWFLTLRAFIQARQLRIGLVDPRLPGRFMSKGVHVLLEDS